MNLGERAVDVHLSLSSLAHSAIAAGIQDGAPIASP
jgi:hypothetical protein